MEKKKSGVTFFQFDDSVDGGDIISQESFDINIEDTIKEVYAKATKKSAEILNRTLPIMEEIKFKKQNKSKLEIWDKRSPKDGILDFNKTCIEIYNFIRAQTIPYPCAFTYLGKNKFKIISAKMSNIDSSMYKNGSIVFINNTYSVSTEDYFIEFDKIEINNVRYNFKDYVIDNGLEGEVFSNIE